MNHTPTPWPIGSYYTRKFGDRLDLMAPFNSVGPRVVVTHIPAEDAAFIVRACNAHDELVAENVRLKAQLAASCDDARSDPESIACPIGYLVGDLAKHLQHLAYACEQTAPHIHTSEARAALAKVTA